MKIRHISLYAFILFTMLSQGGFAQQKIRGHLSDIKSKEALPFANVYIPELSKGTQTNEHGEFLLENLPGRKLKIQFSYMGYKSSILTLVPGSADSILHIEMEATIFEAEEVVISGGTHSTQHENAIKIDLLKSAEIAAGGTPTFMEALTSVPGVDMISKGPGVAKPVIRGLSMTNVLMLNNGVKLENFQFSENHPFIIDEFGAERVEIIKGPASLLYGSDAVGGVINVIREKPAPNGQILGDYGLQYHSNTRGVVTNLGLKGSSESVFWGLRGGIKTHTDYRDGNGDYVPNTRFNEQSLKADLGIKKRFGVFGLYYDYNRPKAGMSVGAAIPLVTGNGRENEYWYQDLSLHVLSSRNTLFLQDFKVDISAAYQANNRRLQTDNSTPSFEMVDMDLNTFSYELKTSLPSGEGEEYIVGLQGAYKTNRNHEAPDHVLPDADVNDFSVFGLAQYTFPGKLKTQAGLRYDLRSISTAADGDREAVDRDYGNLSGSLGATLPLNEDFLLRGNFASAYRTPNIAELTQDGMHGTSYEQGNPDLKSQRSYEGDVSAHYHSKFIMLDVSAFYNHINDYIFMGPSDETTESGQLIYRYSQTDSKLYGGEIVAHALPATWLNISASYAYLVGRQDDGFYLPFIPQNKLRSEIRFQGQNISFLDKPCFKMGVVYAGRQERPSMFETESDPYFLLNAGIGTRIKVRNQLLSLSVQANNLLNEVYIDHLSTLKDLGYANAGRNISISVTVPFGVK